jgi:hypothetical protein
MQEHLAGRLKLYDFHEFAHDALLPRLMLTRQAGPVALHINCSVRKTGSDAKLKNPCLAACVEIVESAGVSPAAAFAAIAVSSCRNSTSMPCARFTTNLSANRRPVVPAAFPPTAPAKSA